MWPFKPARISDEKQAWVDNHFAWAAAQWGKIGLATTPLITQTRAFFSSPRGDKDDTAKAVFAEVQALLGLAETPVTLIAQGSMARFAARDYSRLSEISGTFINDATHPVITYDPTLLGRPLLYISTMAHELMHLRLAPHVDDMPGGALTHELATDLHCIIAGFGIFQLQAADIAGWAGYLSQDTRAYALARFLRETNRPIAEALPFLSGRSAKKLKLAASYVQTPPR